MPKNPWIRDDALCEGINRDVYRDRIDEIFGERKLNNIEDHEGDPEPEVVPQEKPKEAADGLIMADDVT